MTKSKTIFISALTTGLLVLTGCTTQTTTNTNATVNTNTASDNANIEFATNTNTVVTNDNINEADTNENTNSDQESEVDTSEWLTYTNEEYGFSFKYPDGYTIVAQNEFPADFTGETGIGFVFQAKDDSLSHYRVSIILLDQVVNHPTNEDINAIVFHYTKEDDNQVLSKNIFAVKKYSGTKYRVKGLSGVYPQDKEDELSDIGDFYYMDSNERTVLFRITDGAKAFIDVDFLLNSLQF